MLCEATAHMRLQDARVMFEYNRSTAMCVYKARCVPSQANMPALPFSLMQLALNVFLLGSLSPFFCSRFGPAAAGA